MWGLSWGTAWPIFVIAGGLSMVLEPWFGSGKSCLGAKREKEKRQQDLAPVLARMHAALEERVKTVRVTDRLTDSPA